MTKQKYAVKGYDAEKMAKAVGRGLQISTKQSVEVCNFIKGKSVVVAKKLLNEFRLRRSAAYLKDRINTIIPNLKEDSILGQLINDPRINKKKRCKFKDEQLLIEKEDIIQLFIANEILPSNFYSL